MTCENLLFEKQWELQRILERWAEETGILKVGERIVFSLRIEKIATVACEPAAPDLLSATVREFFTRERLKRAGEDRFVEKLPNHFSRLQIRTLQELVGYSREELRRHSRYRSQMGFGDRTLDIIENVLAQGGLSLKRS